MPEQLIQLTTSPRDFPLWQKTYQKLSIKGLYHSPEYIRALESYHRTEAILVVYGDDNNFVYYPFFRKRLDQLPFTDQCSFDLSTFYDIESSWYYGGPILQTVNQSDCSAKLAIRFVEVFKGYCKANNIVSEFVRFDPNLNNHIHFRDSLPIEFNRETIYVDLNLSEKEIWSGYQGRCRTAVRKGKTYPIEIAKCHPSEFLEHFPRIYNLEMERKKAPAHYRFTEDFFVSLFDNLPDNIALFAVLFNGINIGGTICLFDEDGIAYDYLTATLPKYWKYQVNNVLFHHVINWCKQSGLKCFDFHGGRDKVALFKKSFSSLRKRFFLCKVIHIDDIYHELTSLNSDLNHGSQGSDFFPAYRLKDTN